MARLFLLQVGGKAVGALYGFSVGKTFSFYQMGMDPAWQRLSVGPVMMGCTIEEAIRTGHGRFDFLCGDETYKFQWAQDSRRAATHCFFDHRPRSQCAWPEVWARRHLKRLVRRSLAMVRGLLPQRKLDQLINVANARKFQRPSAKRAA